MTRGRRAVLAMAGGALLLGALAVPANADGDGGHHAPPVPDDSYRTIDPATYGAVPGDPWYDYYRTHDADPTNDRTDLSVTSYTVAEQFGCHVDHPYMRWLLDTTRAVVDANYRTMRDAMLDGFVPLGPIPNDFGYPDTYWHWWNQTRSRPRWTELREPVPGGPQPQNTRSWTVQPEDLQHLLLVPSYWENDQEVAGIEAGVPLVISNVTGEEVTNEQTEGETTDGWVTAGVMYATEFDDPPSFTDGAGNEVTGFYPGCQPFHSHGTGVDTPHLHMWLNHHNHPMAMNPPHLCDEHGEPKEEPYGYLDFTRPSETWTCLHTHEEEQAASGGTSPDSARSAAPLGLELPGG